MVGGAHYDLEGRELLAETESLRVQVLTLGPEHLIPWHRHTHIDDTFVPIEGPVIVETRAPDAEHRLDAGERLTVPAGKAHRVQGAPGRGCSFVIIQGVGMYDYVPEP